MGPFEHLQSLPPGTLCQLIVQDKLYDFKVDSFIKGKRTMFMQYHDVNITGVILSAKITDVVVDTVPHEEIESDRALEKLRLNSSFEDLERIKDVLTIADFSTGQEPAAGQVEPEAPV